jgi:hypothetical protein
MQALDEGKGPAEDHRGLHILRRAGQPNYQCSGCCQEYDFHILGPVRTNGVQFHTTLSYKIYKIYVLT